jgi:hypothetical protein
MYISRLAEGRSYRSVAAEFDMSERYASSMAAAVAAAIITAFRTEIAWPTQTEAMRSRDSFLQRTGMANCVAAMDGTVCIQ